MFTRSNCTINDENTLGPQVSSACHGGFDFTLLFEEIFMSAIPIALVLPATLARMWHLRRENEKVNRGALYLLKLISFVALMVVEFSMLVICSLPTTPKTQASIAVVAVSIINTLACCLLSHLEHTRSIRPSSILLGYFLFSTLFDSTRMRTLWEIRDAGHVAALQSAVVGAKILILFLEAREKRAHLKLSYRQALPEATSSILGRTSFWWLNPLFRTAYSKILSSEDLFAVDEKLSFGPAQTKLISQWGQADQEKVHSLTWVFLKFYKWPILAGVLPRACRIAFRFAQPFLVQRTINYMSESDGPNTRNIGYGLIGAYALVYIGIAASTANYEYKTYRVIAMLRCSAVGIVCNKTLQLSTAAVAQFSDAPLTLMSADVERIGSGLSNIHDAWAGIIETSLAIWLLKINLGVAVVAPLVLILTCLVIGIFLALAVGKHQKTWLEAIQRRISVTSSILGSLKNIKISGFAEELSTNIKDLRDTEIHASEKFRWLLVLNVCLSYLSTIMSPFVGFAAFSLMARGTDTLATSQAFACLAIFSLLGEAVGSLIGASMGIATALGCFERIRNFITGESRTSQRINMPSRTKEDGATGFMPRNGSGLELQSLRQNTLPKYDQTPTGCVIAHNSTVGWACDKRPILRSLNFRVESGRLTAVIGPVGCGKSTLLYALLGEAVCFQGTLDIKYSHASFCSQTPWLINGTARQNILGTSLFDEAWYNDVVSSCGLEKDFAQLRLGDQTVVGSKGIRLSGGQQARLSLARAVYANLDVMILDDILAGLDNLTREHIITSLLSKTGLLKRLGKTTIIATHAVDCLWVADSIITLGSQGEVLEQCSFETLKSRTDYSDLALISIERSKSAAEGNKDSRRAIGPDETEQEAIFDQSRATGDLTVYSYYIKTAGWRNCLFFLTICVVVTFGLSFPQIWIQWWTENNAVDPNGRLGYYLGVYGLLSSTTIALLLLGGWQLMMRIVPRCARRFHLALVQTVFSAPTSFLTTTDVGITTNRFSQDLQLIDMQLPLSVFQTTFSAIGCIAQIILIFISSWYIATAIPVLMAVLYVVQRIYLRTSRQLRFLDIEAKSPLFTLFIEAISGLVTIRSFGFTQYFENRNAEALNMSQRPYYLLYCIQQWLNLVLDLIVAAVAIVLVSVATTTRNSADAGLMAVALTNVVNFSASLKGLIVSWTLLETSLGALSRVRSFTIQTASENLPAECVVPPDFWPQKGDIYFKNVSASYNMTDCVLHNISLSIEPGQKVGICGRTGSGKSSLLSTFFRMIELVSGSIIFDGIDITTIPRHELRSRLVIIPQEPFFIIGSVRQNLDPSLTVADHEIITLLKEVSLWGYVQTAGGLDVELNEENFSHGQRQLLCLARGLLRQSPIVIMDEPTSSLDGVTDKTIQQFIRDKLQGCTVIVVAHRLNTIVDFDKVAVMEDGRLLEFDSPRKLLEQPGSAFRNLYNAQQHIST